MAEKKQTIDDFSLRGNRRWCQKYFRFFRRSKNLFDVNCSEQWSQLRWTESCLVTSFANLPPLPHLYASTSRNPKTRSTSKSPFIRISFDYLFLFMICDCARVGQWFAVSFILSRHSPDTKAYLKCNLSFFEKQCVALQTLLHPSRGSKLKYSFRNLFDLSERLASH